MEDGNPSLKEQGAGCCGCTLCGVPAFVGGRERIGFWAHSVRRSAAFLGAHCWESQLPLADIVGTTAYLSKRCSGGQGFRKKIDQKGSLFRRTLLGKASFLCGLCFRRELSREHAARRDDFFERTFFGRAAHFGERSSRSRLGWAPSLRIFSLIR